MLWILIRSASLPHVVIYLVSSNLQVIAGREGQSIETLVWQGQRLFSAGLDGNVNEIDLVKLQIKVSTSDSA